MLDLTALRPLNNTPGELRAALFRTTLAAKTCSDKLEGAVQHRASMLMVGTADALAEAESQLIAAQADASTILVLHAELVRLVNAAPLPDPEPLQLRTEAIAAVSAFATWWQHDGAALQAALVRGFELLAAAALAAGRLHEADTRAAAPVQAGNVVRLGSVPATP